jgi:hypothetical protein
VTGPAQKLAGIRRYQAERPVRTQAKLLEALERMEADRTLVVRPGFRWSKMTLAQEACVNINTVVRKLPSGEWAFPEANERFEQHKRKHLGKREAGEGGEKKIATLLIEVEELRAQNRQLTLEVNRLGRLILAERDRADRMVVYEKQNLSLRKEISRKHRRNVRKEASTKRN